MKIEYESQVAPPKKNRRKYAKIVVIKKITLDGRNKLVRESQTSGMQEAMLLWESEARKNERSKSRSLTLVTDKKMSEKE